MNDTLSDVLRAVRLTGAIFFSIDASAPWVVETPAAPEIGPHIMPGVEHVIEYHVLTRGSCWAGIADEPAVRLQAGDIIVFPQGDAHVMSSAPGLRSSTRDTGVFFAPRPPQLPFALDMHEGGDAVARLDGGGDERATIVCGFLGCDARPFNPLLA